MNTEPYTPDMEDMRIAWGYDAHVSGATEHEADAEFDRFIAKVKADALREATRGGKIDCASSLYLNYLADRIEGEA